MYIKLRRWLALHYSPIIIFLIIFLVSGYFAIIGVDAMHDGMMFRQALDVAEGKTLFKDSFTFYGALSVWLNALALLIFGKYLIVIRLVTAFFYALNGVVLWLIWIRILPRIITFGIIIVWLFLAPYYLVQFHPWPSVPSTLFALLASYFLIRYLEQKNNNLLFAIGISSALAFWFRQTEGIFSFLSISFFLSLVAYSGNNSFQSWLNELKTILKGVLSISSFFLIWIFLSGALRYWLVQDFKFPSVWIKTLGHNYSLEIVFASLFPTLENHVTFLWTTLPIATLFLFFKFSYKILTSKHQAKQNLIMLALTITALSSWQQYYPEHDIRHLYWAGAPMFGLLAYFCWMIVLKLTCWIKQLNSNKKQVRIIIFFVLFASLVFVDVYKRIREGFVKATSTYITMNQPVTLKGLRLSPEQAEMYSAFSHDIKSYLEKHPQKTVLNISAQALFLVLDGNRPNVHPMFIFWGDWNLSIYPDYLQKIISYINTNKPVLITEEPIDIPGYCEKKKYTNPTPDHIALMFPCE